MDYQTLLKQKVIVAENYGIDTTDLIFNPLLFPHQRDIVRFCLEGGRRAIFASFGLGKTFMQLEIGCHIIRHTGKPFLIVCPLGVSGEFKRDNKKLGTGYDVQYITDTDDFPASPEVKIYLTNYERIRKGDINPEFFGGVSFDEASILRNLQTDTTNMVLKYFSRVHFRFVATATPTPNDYIEILNYAVYLGVVSRGHALTRFFQRDPKKAGNLKLYPNKEKEFWQWVATWAAFINTPADLGYDDTGYVLPELEIIEHCVTYQSSAQPVNRFGEPILFKQDSNSLSEASREKRDSLAARINKACEIAETIDGNMILWCHLNDEQAAIESNLKGQNFVSVSGADSSTVKEDALIGFSDGKYKYLITKPKIAGQGCNFQDHSHDMIFCGIDYKFNDFIQAIHREYRFGQKHKVRVHVIYTPTEYGIMKTLHQKWGKHRELNTQMIALVREYGLNSNLIKANMERQIFSGGQKVTLRGATLYNNDTVVVHADKNEMPDNSVGMILTSIPFGNHYEYSDNYNDFGHNKDNEKFFEQMDFLTPNLLRVLQPGRVACIHVKDRIRYSYQNGTSFTTIEDFSGQTVAHFVKHGFHLIGKITVTTDVVAENNQTYRLGWSEQCKDGSKMGVGLPEYVLLFRKAPTHADNSYSDEPVVKEKTDYTKALWQLDAHAFYRSSGDRFMTPDELKHSPLSRIVAAWEKLNKSSVYDFNEHVRACDELDKLEKLSSTFTTIPVHSTNEFVWTDVNRMRTLNANQVNSKKEKHICPLQFDIIERLINRYSMPGELVDDPFGGLFSTPYKAMEMGRKAVSAELNTEYFNDGVYYCRAKEYSLSVPTLFDAIVE